MKGIFRQSSYLFLAQTTARLVGFFYTIFLARNLEIADFGLYGAALAYYSLISTIAEFGFNRFLVKEVAINPKNGASFIFGIGLLRVTIASVLFGIFAVVFYLFDPDKLRVNLTLLAILAVLPTSLAQTVDSIFVGTRKLQFSAIAVVLTSLVTLMLGVALVSQGFSVGGVMVALLLGQTIYFLILFFFLKREKLLTISRIKYQMILEITKGSLPYGILGVLSLLYFRIDTLMLSYLKGNYDTGIYTAAYKFLEASVLIPSSLAIALFPVMAKLHDLGGSEIKKVYQKSLLVLGGISILVLLGYLFILPEVIKLLLPNYLPAIQIIQILSFSVPFIYLATPGVQVMLSTDKYLKAVIFGSLFMLFFNVLLNFILIPQFSYIGAAWVTVASDILSFIIFYLLINFKILKK